jgi:hypothetical protein
LIPDETKLAEKTFEELKNLKISKLEWDDNITLSITLSNGESCTAGPVCENK